MWEEAVISQRVSHPGWGNRWLRRPTFPFEWQNVARFRSLGQTTRSPCRGRKCPQNQGYLPPERSLRQTARGQEFQRELEADESVRGMTLPPEQMVQATITELRAFLAEPDIAPI